MRKAFQAELQKIKYRKLWLLIIGISIFEFLWHGMTMLRADQTYLLTGYHYLLYSLPLMNALVMPLVLAVLASRIWDIEYKGNTYKLLYTLQSKKSIYYSKAFFGSLCITAFCFLQIITVIVCGRLFHFSDQLPAKHLFYLFITTLVVCLANYYFQQLLSFQYHNQFIALSIGLAGSFVGLFSAFLPGAVKRFIPWSYYTLLSTSGMDWNNETQSMSFYYTSPDLPALLTVSCLTILLLIGSKSIFLRKEV